VRYQGVKGMKVILVIEDWIDCRGSSVNKYEDSAPGTIESFHHGISIKGTLALSKEAEKELKSALEVGLRPVVWIDRDETIKQVVKVLKV
jgi:hypothetical protein